MSLRPYVEPNQIRELVDRVYGRNVVKSDELESFADRNFKVTVTDQGCSDELKTETYILKVVNYEESRNLRLQYKIDDVQRRLETRGFSCTRSMPDLEGRTFSLHKFPRNTPEGVIDDCVVRLLAFMKGRPLGDDKSLLTTNVLRELGSLLALFHRTLKDIPSDGLEVDPTNKWALQNPRQVLLYFTPQLGKDQQLLSDVISTFADRLEASENSLRKGVIHGDFHDFNVIIDWHTFDCPKPIKLPEVRHSREHNMVDSLLTKYSIIDFNEISYSYPILDLTRLICEMMCASLQANNNDISPKELSDVSKTVLSGYNEIEILSDAEWEILYSAIAFGFSQMIVLKQYNLSVDPTNIYASKGIAERNTLLKAWLAMDSEETIRKIRMIV